MNFKVTKKIQGIVVPGMWHFFLKLDIEFDLDSILTGLRRVVPESLQHRNQLTCGYPCFGWNEIWVGCDCRIKLGSLNLWRMSQCMVLGLMPWSNCLTDLTLDDSAYCYKLTQWSWNSFAFLKACELSYGFQKAALLPQAADRRSVYRNINSLLLHSMHWVLLLWNV